MPTHQNAPKSDRRRNTEWDHTVNFDVKQPIHLTSHVRLLFLIIQ